jgi:hypothetical protein
LYPKLTVGRNDYGNGTLAVGAQKGAIGDAVAGHYVGVREAKAVLLTD